jgi:hypothetical protein
MQNRFIVIDIPLEQSLSDKNAAIYAATRDFFDNTFSYSLTSRQNIRMELNKHDFVSYDNLTAARAAMNLDKFQIVVEFDPENFRVKSMHEGFFALRANNALHASEMSHLFFASSHDFISRNRLVDSMTYGFLTELAKHNSADLVNYTRGVDLYDYLYQHQPAHSYKITKKDISSRASWKNYTRN